MPCGFAKALVFEIHGISELGRPRYRFGDGAKWLTRKTKGVPDQVLHPRVTITLPYSRADGCKTSAETSFVEAVGGIADIRQVLILPIGSETVLSTARVDVTNAVGVQGALRGEPNIGSAEVDIMYMSGSRPVELGIAQGEEQKGIVSLTVRVENRQVWAINVGKKALLKTPGLNQVALMHWGIGLTAGGSAEEHVYEVYAVRVADGKPNAILGPKGPVAHAIPKGDWESWKVASWAERERMGVLPPAASKLDYPVPQPDGSVPDSAVKYLCGRAMHNFDSYIGDLGLTMRTPEEIEAFIIPWVARHTEYHCLRANCQVFVKDLYRFLTGGDHIPHMLLEDLGTGTANAVCATAVAPVKVARAICREVVR